MSDTPDFPEHELRERCRTVLALASDEARRLAHDYVGVEHVFIALTRDEESLTSSLLQKAGFSPREVRSQIRADVKQGDGSSERDLALTHRLQMVLSLALLFAEGDRVFQPTEQHILMAMLQEGESLPVRKLAEMGFDINFWLNDLIAKASEESVKASDASDLVDRVIRRMREPDFGDENFDALFDSNEFSFMDDDLFSPSAPKPSTFPPPRAQPDPNRPVATPLLDKYGRDLNAQAKLGKIGPAVARETEIRAIARTLSRSKKNNPLLLGDAGVGKTAVVEGLAYAIQSGSAPTALLKWRIVQIEIGVLVAGTSLRGQFEERLLGILEEVKHAGNVIVFIDEIHTIVGAGETIDSNLDAANILKPALARGEIMCIGATTHEEYRRAIAKDPALDRRFRPIDIPEPTMDDAIEILRGQRQRLETHHGVVILQEAVEAAVKLSVRYLTDRRLPDKGLDLLDEACTRVVIRTRNPDEEELGEANEVRADDVAHVLSEWTGIPAAEMTRDERQRLARIEQELLARVVGQDEAVMMVADAIKTARAGLGDPNRPIGTFLFLGPSGVGKTELARTLAASLFGSEEALLRLDMSEFHDAHTAARLIGSPPGYKDASRGGQLTEGLRRRPYSVVLLDEIEKAAPEVFDLFLQVFDEGRLSDAHGRKVDCRHAVFIMTSNIGSVEGNRDALGFRVGEASVARDYRVYLSKYFRPEFINRLDEVITFNALSRDVVRRIMDKQLTEVYQRMGSQRLSLTLTDSARDIVMQAGYEPTNGARPMRRAIERLLTRPLSTFLLSETLEHGSTIIADTGEHGKLAFSATPPTATAPVVAVNPSSESSSGEPSTGEGLDAAVEG
ncbi:MAG: ATP-dependent Clp protease ATP-binding subunit [Anaerolineae bacterium]|nr:ATP-dependent Clp protease ATP-binding subunit [Anaerolineae bacterium]